MNYFSFTELFTMPTTYSCRQWLVNVQVVEHSVLDQRQLWIWRSCLEYTCDGYAISL